MSDGLPFVAIPMGDAAGIGPEIILKALAAYYPRTARPVLVGRYDVFERAATIVGSTIALKRIADPVQGDYRPGVANILEARDDTSEGPVPFGEISALSGRSQVLAVRTAYEISSRYPIKAIVAAPLQKQAINEAGLSYSDECELMADLTGASMPMMLLISGKMRMATVPPLHVSLKQACENLTPEQILRSLSVLRESLVSLGIPDPVVAAAALNPHGGEGGAMGDEEIRAIVPAVKEAQDKGWDVRGPFPADSLFFRASKGEFDAVLCMYHDQGRIAMKTTDFGHLVSIMIGVPVPYLTVAHGTAYEIAGAGKADPANFIDLLQFVDRLQGAKRIQKSKPRRLDALL